MKLKAKDKWEAITELIDSLILINQIIKENRQGVIDAVIKREHTMSTGIGHGFAVPHSFSSLIDKPLVAYGWCDGLDFQSVDNRPTKVIILVLTPAHHISEHLHKLASISKSLSKYDLDTMEPESICSIYEELHTST